METIRLYFDLSRKEVLGVAALFLFGTSIAIYFGSERAYGVIAMEGLFISTASAYYSIYRILGKDKERRGVAGVLACICTLGAMAGIGELHTSYQLGMYGVHATAIVREIYYGKPSSTSDGRYVRFQYREGGEWHGFSIETDGYDIGDRISILCSSYQPEIYKIERGDR
ncbi:MAG: hypothetical protein ABI876_13975 [Bacteroidota bacterium]